MPKIMSFNRDKFLAHLAHLTPQTQGRSLFLFDTVASTNTTLSELLNTGAPIGSIAIAATQTAGRGQWGRTWVSQPGGLYLSMAIAPNLPATQSARLTLASAWGIATQLRHHQIPVQLKWPNDLYLSDQKLGGILTETAIRQATIHQAIIGVGMNWANHTPETAIALNNPPIPMTPPITSLEHLAALVVNGIENGLRSLQHSELKHITPDYRQWLYQPLPPDLSWETL